MVCTNKFSSITSKHQLLFLDFFEKKNLAYKVLTEAKLNLQK